MEDLTFYLENPQMPLGIVQVYSGAAAARCYRVPRGYKNVRAEVTTPGADVFHIEGTSACDGSVSDGSLKIIIPASASGTCGVSTRGIKIYLDDDKGNTYAVAGDFVVLKPDGTTDVVETGGDISHSEFADVETVDDASSLGEVKSTLNAVIETLKGSES